MIVSNTHGCVAVCQSSPDMRADRAEAEVITIKQDMDNEKWT